MNEQDRASDAALSDVDSIQNLDTARLALRWALERLRGHERRVQETEEACRRAEAAGARNATELSAARDLLNRRSAEALERERYYAKLEEYLSLKLAGQLDAPALVRRETELQRRESELQQREIGAESRLRAAKLQYEDELRRGVADASGAADARVRDMREELDQRLALREREQSARLLSLHEKEAELKILERSLEERRRRFEAFFAAQRGELEREISALAQTAQDQAEMREQRVEQALASKSKALEASWLSDRRVLLEELAEWRAKAREHLPALLAATRRADEADDRLARLEAALGAARREAEEHLGEVMARDLTEGARREDFRRLESVLSARLREAEENLLRQYDSWLKREEELHHRDQTWRQEAGARREATEALRGEILTLREELKRVIAAYRAKTETPSRPLPGPGDPL